MCGVPEYLVSCRLCASRFCCRRIGYDESSDAELDETGAIKLTDTPQDDDEHELEEGCIVMNHYSLDGRRPPLEQAKREFVCYDCWNHAERGLYPVGSFNLVGCIWLTLHDAWHSSISLGLYPVFDGRVKTNRGHANFCSYITWSNSGRKPGIS